MFQSCDTPKTTQDPNVLVLEHPYIYHKLTGCRLSSNVKVFPIILLIYFFKYLISKKQKKKNIQIYIYIVVKYIFNNR
jgi:hypothetical protein